MVKVGTSKGSKISHMAAVHQGHYLPGALQEKKRRRNTSFCSVSAYIGVLLGTPYIYIGKDKVHPITGHVGPQED